MKFVLDAYYVHKDTFDVYVFKGEAKGFIPEESEEGAKVYDKESMEGDTLLIFEKVKPAGMVFFKRHIAESCLLPLNMPLACNYAK